MKAWHWILSGVVAATLALPATDANALVRRNQVDQRVTVAGTVVGLGTTAAFFGLRGWKLNRKGRYNGIGPAGAAVLTTGGCLALSPIFATVAVQRELTFREAYGLAADCVIPFVGSYLVDQAFDANPHWEPKPKKVRR